MNGKPRICHVASGDLWAGAEVQVFNILAGLARMDEFKLYAIIMNKGRLYQELVDLGINVQLVDEKELNIMDQLKTIRAFLKENRIDIIHSHRYKENIFSAIVNYSLGKPSKLIKTQHGSFNIASTKRMKIYRAIDLVLTKLFFQIVIAVSFDIAKQFTQFLPKKRRVHTIHNGIESAKYKVSVNQDSNPAGKKILNLAIIGRLVKIKNIGEFIEIVIRLNKNGVEACGHIAGDGPERQNLINLVRCLEGEDFIHFLGNVEDISSLYAKIDFLLITSIHEGIPTVILEAMYFGKIVIARRVGGIPEIIRHGYNGFLYDNIEAAIEIVEMIRSDEPKWQQIILNAKADVAKNYTNIIQADKYSREYKDLFHNI